MPTDDPASRIPPELYRKIISYVDSRSDLLSLSMTSLALGYEAERKLYRTLAFGDDENMNHMTPAHFQECGRNHPHVRHLYIQIRTDSGALNASKILVSVKNLKRLNIYCSLPSTQFLPSSPPFQLHELEATHVSDLSFHTFLRSQRELNVIRWDPEELMSPHVSNYFTPQDLPVLRVLDLYQPLVELLLPSRPIRYVRIKRNINWPLKKLLPLPTVYALQVFTLMDAAQVAELFPNLQCMEVRYYMDAMVHILHLFPNLKIFRLQKSIDLVEAAAIFECNEALDVIQYASEKYVWSGVGRGLQVRRGLDRKVVTLAVDDWCKVG